jgi:anti-sigma factor RsiW
MDCGGVRALINRYIDGELGYVETAEFQQHLDFCPDCSLELRELGELRGTLAAWGGVPLSPPAGFADRVVAAVATEPLPGSPRPLADVVDDALERLDRTLGKVALPGGRTMPVKNLIGWGIAVAAVVIGFGRRRGHDESEVRVP